LAAPRDVLGLAAATCWMLDHPLEAAVMGAQARVRVRRHFSPEQMCGVLDELYRGLLGLKPADHESEDTPASPGILHEVSR
jgi:hypothetical protein